MHNVVFGECLEGLEYVSEIGQSFCLVEVPLRLDKFLECTPIAILIHKVVVVDCLQYLYEFDHMIVLLDVGKRLDLVYGALLQFGAHLELLDFDHFYGN